MENNYKPIWWGVAAALFLFVLVANARSPYDYAKRCVERAPDIQYARDTCFDD